MTAYRILAAACCLAAGTAALAGEIDSDGKGMGKSMITPHQVAEDHMMMQMHTEYSDFSFDTADHPMNGMSGPCFGAVEINAGAVSGGGKCLYADADGDMVTMDWAASGLTAEGAMTGIWTVSGGTGKWMEAKGEGTFSSLTNPDTGENVNTVSGSLLMP